MPGCYLSGQAELLSSTAINRVFMTLLVRLESSRLLRDFIRQSYALNCMELFVFVFVFVFANDNITVTD